ncbi:MAG: hypothetical protein AAF329_28650 [Cyanobacteria bacterium P01_A01_bin.17]
MTAKLLMPLALLAVLGLPTKAIAHVIETDYLLPSLEATSDQDAPSLEAEGADSSAITFTSQFTSGEPFKNAKITIYAPGNDEKPWLVSEMDENGEFEFEPDKSIEGDWTIEIGEGGHWDSWTVPVKAKGKSVTYGEISDASSQFPEIPAQLLVIGAACLSGGVGSTLLRRKRSA